MIGPAAIEEEEAGHADAVVDLYRRHSEAFDRLRGRTLFERHWLERFVDGLPRGASVLDMGCGSGEPIAAYLISKRLAVTGIDSSPGMIALCRERFPSQLWLEGDMRDLSTGFTYAGVVAWNSFFHLAQECQRAMFSLFAQHCDVGGKLMFTSGPAAGTAMGEMFGEPLFHASLDPEEYRELLGLNGFKVLDYVAEDPKCNGHTIWLAERI